jgi:hypothetical protein
VYVALLGAVISGVERLRAVDVGSVATGRTSGALVEGPTVEFTSGVNAAVSW